MIDSADPAGTVSREQLVQVLDGVLRPAAFKDHCPNGLQVQGREAVRCLVSGVTASLAMIEAAVAQGADALLVHHGLFWRGHDGRLTGWLRERVAELMRHDINLLAYHLPLDAHAELGNNAQLARRLGLEPQARFGDQDLGWLGRPVDGTGAPQEVSLAQLQTRVTSALGKVPVVVAGDGRTVRRVAWCTGGAQSLFEQAIDNGADVYLTGEISEPQAHLARECGVAYLACGHHATERDGAQAVGAFVAAQLGLRHVHINIDNPA